MTRALLELHTQILFKHNETKGNIFCKIKVQNFSKIEFTKPVQQPKDLQVALDILLDVSDFQF